MALGMSDPRVLSGDNPFGVAEDHYARCHNPDYDDYLWSETHFWSCWNADERVGFFIHTGVTPEDHDLWWAQVMLYLPDGRALADISWGRSPDRDGPRTGNFHARSMKLGHFHLTYDGAGEISSTADMANRVVGGGHCMPFRFDVEIAPAMPVWDLFKAANLTEREWGGTHHEQVHTCRGELQVGGPKGRSYRLDGVTFRDHSIGRRDFSGLGGDHLFGGHFPDSGRSIQTLLMWNNTGGVEVRVASIWEDGELELIGDVEMTGVEHGTTSPRSLTKLTGEPLEFDLTMVRRTGERVAVGCEVEHNVNMSNTDPNTNLNGIELGVGDKVLLLAESQLKLTWPDGEVGYGHLERGYRRNLLPAGAI
jgi:hypothetical protein